MALTRQSLEILLDLLEMKVNALQIQDRDDARELNKLRKCRIELLSQRKQPGPHYVEETPSSNSAQRRPHKKISSSRC